MRIGPASVVRPAGDRPRNGRRVHPLPKGLRAIGSRGFKRPRSGLYPTIRRERAAGVQAALQGTLASVDARLMAREKRSGERRAPRFETQLWVGIPEVEGAREVEQCNISATGLMLRTRRDVGSLGAVRMLRLVTADLHAGISIMGHVVREVTVLIYNFGGGRMPLCLAACDSNADGSIGGVTDAVYILVHSFVGGPLDSSSITLTVLLLASRSTIWDPMKPAPPVTKIVLPVSSGLGCGPLTAVTWSGDAVGSK